MKSPAIKIFSIVFGVVYIVSFYMDWSLFRYYPETSEFHIFRRPDLGIVILWYGWIVTSALISGAVAFIVPRSWAERLSPTWVWAVPAIVIIVTLIYERRWFV